MKKTEEICVIVQARLGSQRVPQKMIKPFAGTTLSDIALDKILGCSAFHREQFYFSAWEPELKQIASKKGLNVFPRSEASAKSEGTPMTEMYEWWDKLPYKYAILVNGCTPFLKPKTIDDFFLAYLNSDSDGMFGVMEKKNYFWNSNKEILTPLTEAVMNTKTVNITYEAAHCLYAGKMESIGHNVWMGDFMESNSISLFPMHEKEVLDIDHLWQFDMCQALWNEWNIKGLT